MTFSESGGTLVPEQGDLGPKHHASYSVPFVTVIIRVTGEFSHEGGTGATQEPLVFIYSKIPKLNAKICSYCRSGQPCTWLGMRH